MDYTPLYSLQLSPLCIGLLVIAAIAAITLLATILPTLNLIIRNNRENRHEIPEPEDGISVIVSTSFHTDRLRSFVENIYAQNYSKPIEIIIVNTGGEDFTEDTIRLLQADFPEIKNTFVPLHSRNLSKRKLAITLGIKAASYPIVLLTSANAAPAGANWLASVMNQFRKGADIVIGTSVMENSNSGENIGKVRAFDTMKSLLRKIPEAVKCKPVGADAANLAYRKALFFDNRGFCETLNLNYGDDDLFISEIARDHTVMVDLSPDSIVTLHEDTPARIYDLERISHSFTQSKLRRAPFILSGFQDLLWWIWIIASIAGIICALPSLIGAACAFVTAAILILPLSIKWKKATSALSLPAHTSILPLLSLANPIISLRYKIHFGKKTRNYTWQN